MNLSAKVLFAAAIACGSGALAQTTDQFPPSLGGPAVGQGPAGAPPIGQGPSGMRPPGTPTPGGNSQDFDEQHRRYLIGEWYVETPSPVTTSAVIRTQIRYAPDHSFRGFQQTVASFGGPQPAIATQPLNGRWSIQGINATRFMLTIQSPSGVGTSVLDILDQDRLRNNDAGYVATRISR